MARCFSAKKSKAGKEIKCGRCSAKIEPGETYFYFSVGFRGSKQIRCGKHRPRQSELCGSKLSGVYAAIESVEDALGGTIEEIADALESAASEVENVRDEYQDSYDNLGDNFQNGSPGEQIQEKIDACEEFASTLSDAAEEIRNMTVDEYQEEEGGLQEDAEEKMLADAIDKATDAIGEFSL